MKSLRELFDEACAQVQAGNKLDQEFLSRISLVLIAGGLSPIEDMKLDHLSDQGGRVYIELDPGYENLYRPFQRQSLSFPSRILDDHDPVTAAKIWRLEKQACEFKALVHVNRVKVEKNQAAYEATVKQLQLLKGIRRIP
jgi:hypothetical protein